MPTPQDFLWHRHLACEILVAQASCLCKYLGRARCPPHKNFCGTGILPVQIFGAGKMPTPQEFLWH
ncbi:hypothetical protein QUB17_19840, partial [Microcoleus sp. B5-C4]